MPSYRIRRKQGWVGLLLTVLTLLLMYGQHQGWLGAVADTAENNQPGLYRVTQFVDGDTIGIDMNGRTEKIRMIGVDTPETHKPNTPVQCYGPAASAYTKNLIGNQRVRLASDALSTDRDRYDRLLRYVYLPDSTLVNQKLIENGYGFYYPYFEFSKSADFERAQQSAQASHKGLWGNCRPVQNERGGYESQPL